MSESITRKTFECLLDSSDVAAGLGDVVDLLAGGAVDISELRALAIEALAPESNASVGPLAVALGMAYEFAVDQGQQQVAAALAAAVAPLAWQRLAAAPRESGVRACHFYLVSHFAEAIDASAREALDPLERAQLDMTIPPAAFDRSEVAFADADNCPAEPNHVFELWKRSRACVWAFLGAKAYVALVPEAVT